MDRTTIGEAETIVQSGLEALRNALVSPEVTLALKYLLPEGLRPIVQLGSDVQRNSTASAWNPETGAITIHFQRAGTQAPTLPAEPVVKPPFQPLEKLDVRFHPVKVHGEPASVALLRDRGDY